MVQLELRLLAVETTRSMPRDASCSSSDGPTVGLRRTRRRTLQSWFEHACSRAVDLSPQPRWMLSWTRLVLASRIVR